MSALGYKDIVDLLRKEIPEFALTIEDHISFYGEVLAHPLFGDLTRFIEQALSEGNIELVSRCLSLLEQVLIVGDDQSKNLVAVSFVENVGPWDPPKTEFIKRWPPALREEAKRQKDWGPQ